MFYSIENENGKNVVRFLCDSSGVEQMSVDEAKRFALRLLNDLDGKR